MKKLVCLFLSIFMLATMTACGGENTNSSEPAVSEKKEMTEMIDVTSMSLTDALTELKAAGFANVTSNADSDKEWDENRWVVISQSVEAGTSYALTDKIELTCKKKCLLYLDLTSEANLILSTYDMDIYIGDKQVGTVANGKTITKLMQVIEGNYTLMACKSGDNSVKATKELSVNTDMTFKSDIAHGGSSIEFKNMETTDSIVGASIKVPDVTGKILRDAMTELEEAGFINVREEPNSDIWDKDNWIVTKQGVEAGTEVDQNEYIQLDCIKLDEYFNKTYSGKTLAEVEKLAEQSGFTLKYANDEDKSDLEETVKTLEDKTKEYWTVTSAELYSGDSKIAKVYLKYEGSPEEKKAEEEKKKAEEEKKKAEEEKKAAEEKKKAEEEKKAAEEKKKAEEEKKKAEEEATAAAAAQAVSAGTESGSQAVESTQTVSDEDIPYNKVENFGLTTSTDYVHISSETITLGNNEYSTFTINATPAGLSEDDFIFVYDEALLEGGIYDISSNEASNITTLTYKIRAISAGTSDVYLCSAYDYCTLEEFPYYQVSVHGLDSREGQVVYVTPTGEKYHFSASCAGENLITTTLYDAELDEYKPCGKCAS